MNPKPKHTETFEALHRALQIMTEHAAETCGKDCLYLEQARAALALATGGDND